MKKLVAIMIIILCSAYSFAQSFTITNFSNCDLTVRVWAVSTAVAQCNAVNWRFTNYADLAGGGSNGITYTSSDLPFGGSPFVWLGFEVLDQCQANSGPGTTCEYARAIWDNSCGGPQQCLEITCNSLACPLGTNVVPTINSWGTAPNVDLN